MDKLVLFDVTHARHTPKRYVFKHKFFWFKLDLNNLQKSSSSLFKVNKLGLYSFFDSDHMDLGKDCARDNFIKFAIENGLDSEVRNIWLYTQCRFLCYVFNPVSFILIEDSIGRFHSIIEIGNTFNELKPFFVHNDHFNGNSFDYSTIKHFYISPFIAHDNKMTFKFRKEQDHLNIHIDDFSQDEKTLTVSLKGKEVEASHYQLLKLTLTIPFVTFQIIGLIHYHAFRLWLKGIRFYKKSEYPELQKGMFLWKKPKK
jgi:DUF1365 family protein